MSTTYVIFRHADDRVKSVHKQDPPITKSGKKNTRVFAQDLIRKYGVPHEVRISPFRRTRETFEALEKELGDYKNVYVDINLSRHFSKKERKKPKVSDETLQYEIPIDEDTRKFRERVRTCAKSLRSYDENKTIWIITHALVVKEMAKHFSVNISDNIDFLQHFTITI